MPGLGGRKSPKEPVSFSGPADREICGVGEGGIPVSMW